MQARVLDEARALVFFGGSREVYARALAHFVRLYRDGIPEIGAYLAIATTAQLEPLRRRVHEIAGAAGALGAVSLVHSATAVEAAVLSQRFGAHARASVETLQRELACAVDAATLALGDALPE